MKQNNSLKLNLLDPKFNRRMLQYYQWMCAFGILLFGILFLAAGCVLPSCLQLSVGIACMPPLRKKITLRCFGIVCWLLLMLSFSLCVIGYGS